MFLVCFVFLSVFGVFLKCFWCVFGVTLGKKR